MTTETQPTPTRSRSRLWLAGLAVLLVVALAAVWFVSTGRLPFLPPSFNGIVMQSPDPVQDFTLDASTGERLSLSDLRGKVVLIYFGYTFCPDACPATMSQLKKVPAELGRDAEDVQVLMITVDPERDTPEVLREYLAHFDPSFIGLTGTDDEILAAATPFGIFYNKHQGTAATGYLVDHTTSVVALDKEGTMRLIYPFDTSGEAIAEDVRVLLRE